MHDLVAYRAVLSPWRHVLAQRTTQAIDTFSRVPGIIGLILAGSVGRGEPWPLSDIDLILLYNDDHAAIIMQAVEHQRVALLDEWIDEGFGATSLDVGKLRFTRSEVTHILAHPPREATHWLDDARWFHSLDKGYRSHAALDSIGLAGPLAQWLTDTRFTEEVTHARQQINHGQLLQRYHEARHALQTNDVLGAGIALRESLHVLMRYLMEQWGERDTSFARFGTRFEQTAIVQGAGQLAEALFALYQLSPAEVTRRMTLIPEGIRHRHYLSFAARQLVDETVTVAQDARDVLLVFGTIRLRRSSPPYADWLALEMNVGVLTRRLAAYDALLERAGIELQENHPE